MISFCVMESWLIREDRFWILTSHEVRDLGGTYILCTHILSTYILHFSQSGFFRLSRSLSHTWAHIEYPSSVFVCTRVYKHTHTHHPNTRKNWQIYKTSHLSLPLPKYSFPRREQAPSMNKLKKTPLPIPLHTRMQVLKNTCDTHTCSREIGQYK